jgi:hypothetical protein
MASFDALARLIDEPARSAALAKKQLAKGVRFEGQGVAKLIADLDSDKFKVRDEAARELEKLGWAAEPAMREAIARKPSAEVLGRLTTLLEKLPEDRFDGIAAFASRLTEMLEHIGSSEARAILTDLAKGPADARLAQEASASLKRLEAVAPQRK